MQVRDFTKEEIPKAIAKWLEEIIIYEPYELHEIITMIRNGKWLEDLSKAEETWK